MSDFGSLLQAGPGAGSPPGGALAITGSTSSTGFGVDLSGQYGGAITARNGATIDITGSHAGGTGPSLNLRDGLAIGDSTSGAANFTANSPAAIGAAISVGGPIKLLADDVTILLGGSLRSAASGDAIIIAGKSGPNTIRFENMPAPPRWSTPNGRWLIYRAEHRHRCMPGGLPYDFKQYDARFGEAISLTPATGNGLLYAEAPTVTVSAPPLSKTYDGTTATGPLSAASLSFSGQRDGDVPSVAAGATGSLPTRMPAPARPSDRRRGDQLPRRQRPRRTAGNRSSATTSPAACAATSCARRSR